MVTVFDKDGKAHQRDPVDARECVDRLGWTMEHAGGTAPAASGSDDAPAAEKAPNRSVAELRGLLDQRNIPWTSAIRKAGLEELVAGSDPEA